jgi:hypothetical protein
MAELDMRTALAHGDESEFFQHAANLGGLKNRDIAHD